MCSNILLTTVVAAVIETEGMIFIGQRRPDQSHPLKWEFPGGKVESGEQPRDALARELWEELRIQAVIGGEISRYPYAYGDQSPILLIFYAVTEYLGIPDNQIYQCTAWVPRRDLPGWDFLDGDTEIVNQLQNF